MLHAAILNNANDVRFRRTVTNVVTMQLDGASCRDARIKKYYNIDIHISSYILRYVIVEKVLKGLSLCSFYSQLKNNPCMWSLEKVVIYLYEI